MSSNLATSASIADLSKGFLDSGLLLSLFSDLRLDPRLSPPDLEMVSSN